MDKTVNTTFKPELLAPAGSLEKLKVALSYGADAVYLGGQKFGLRAASENFTIGELQEAREFSKNLGKHIFVVLNGFLHDQDLIELVDYVKVLNEIKVDAVIVSDLGVLEIVREYSDIPVHVSTQASVLNVESAKFWKDRGATRVILGRESSIKDAGIIKQETGLEVELFIHGSMCMAYSGNCVISNYTAGRDSNRGGCAHSCRFEYSFEGNNNKKIENSFFMSSKDLNGLQLIPEFIHYEIDSLKIEGRMKGPLYAGTVSKAYRMAIDAFLHTGDINNDLVTQAFNELNNFSHRDYSQASLLNPAGKDSVFDKRDEKDGTTKVAAYVKAIDIDTKHMILDVRRAFNAETNLELVPFEGLATKFKAKKIVSMFNDRVERTNPSTLVKIPMINGAKIGNIIRQEELC